MGCSTQERSALFQFRKKIQDPNKLLNNWIGKECCRWDGIVCNNNTNGVVHVVELDLSRYYQVCSTLPCLSFLGLLDPSLLFLKHLKHLDLKGLRFIQSPDQVSRPNLILEFISEFHDLRYLSVFETHLSGIIPSKILSLSRIKHLDLSMNQLKLQNGGSLFSNLSSLNYLDMSEISLMNTSGWLESLNALPSISIIRLEFCDIGSISDSVLPHLNFSSLKKLDLSNNPRMIDSGFPDWLFSLPNIEDLNFKSVVSIAIGFPSGIQNLRKLRSFDFSYNHFVGSIPESLGNFSVHLRVINLYNNKLNRSIPKSIGNLRFLEKIDLSGNILGGSIPKSIGNLHYLQEINLFSNRLIGLIPNTITILSLRKLDISDNYITGKIPTSIGTQLPSLQHLNLQNNALDGFIPNSIGKLKFLGPIPKSLCNLTKLKVVRISHNYDINGAIPKCLFHNPHLIILDIGGRDLKGLVLESDFGNLSKLTVLMLTQSKNLVLNLSRNWIPPFDLSFLYLSYCEIGNEFPLWIQTQKKLITLSITSTRMSSTLPTWIWDFSSMISYIQLSDNRLIGSLPDYTTNISRNLDINLRNNKFEGTLNFVYQHMIFKLINAKLL